MASLAEAADSGGWLMLRKEYRIVSDGPVRRRKRLRHFFHRWLDYRVTKLIEATVAQTLSLPRRHSCRCMAGR